jgi:hypothetical protein
MGLVCPERQRQKAAHFRARQPTTRRRMGYGSSEVRATSANHPTGIGKSTCL